MSSGDIDLDLAMQPELHLADGQPTKDTLRLCAQISSGQST
jgi:hypothetical protein